jgi:ubiquinone biosynthesis accessory factor UbiJ
MATSSPFSLLNSIFGDIGNKLSTLQPPAWAIDEVQHCVVLLLNHVLMQEPEAMARLARVKVSVVRVQWQSFTMTLAATPAGLLERADDHTVADLSLLVADDSLASLVQTVLAGGKPLIKIEGDVRLAAEVNWLVDHVRWDIEEDLSRILGDAPARAVVSVTKQVVSTLKSFLVTKVADADSTKSDPAKATS